MSGKNRTSPEKIGPLVHPDMSGKYQTSPNLINNGLTIMPCGAAVTWRPTKVSGIQWKKIWCQKYIIFQKWIYWLTPHHPYLSSPGARDMGVAHMASLLNDSIGPIGRRVTLTEWTQNRSIQRCRRSIMWSYEACRTNLSKYHPLVAHWWRKSGHYCRNLRCKSSASGCGSPSSHWIRAPVGNWESKPALLEMRGVVSFTKIVCHKFVKCACLSIRNYDKNSPIKQH